MENCGCRFFFTVEFPPYLGGNTWEACGDKMSYDWQVIVLQLQGFPLNHSVCPCGCQHKFMWVDVGINGSSSDVQIFNNLQLRAGIIDGTLQVPAAEPLPSDDCPMH